jgi:hypothetical protein
VTHANLQGMQLFLEVGITVSTFFIFHISLSELGIVNSTDLSCLGTYISIWNALMTFKLYNMNVCMLINPLKEIIHDFLVEHRKNL